MNKKICENCGYEHNGDYGSGRFCSVKCSKAFSTKAKRKEINKKVSKTAALKNKKIKKCVSCKEEIKSNSKTKYCDACKQFFKYRTMFKKLGIYESNIKVANNKSLDILLNMYFKDKKSSCEIYEQFKIKENTLYNYFNKNDIRLRNNKHANIVAYTNGRLMPQSNFKYQSGPHETWFGNKVFLRSSYEKTFAEYLDNKRIFYKVESERIQYKFKNEEHVYVSDFYIPSKNLLIEIKSSYFYNEAKEQNDIKLRAAKEKGYNVILLLDNNLSNIEKLI